MPAHDPTTPTQRASLQLRLADSAAIADIVDGAARCTDISDGIWLDIRPMLDAREHSGEALDMYTEAIDYALWRKLITRHPDPQQPHLVRVAGRTS